MCLFSCVMELWADGKPNNKEKKIYSSDGCYKTRSAHNSVTRYSVIAYLQTTLRMVDRRIKIFWFEMLCCGSGDAYGRVAAVTRCALSTWLDSCVYVNESNTLAECCVCVVGSAVPLSFNQFRVTGAVWAGWKYSPRTNTQYRTMWVASRTLY